MGQLAKIAYFRVRKGAWAEYAQRGAKARARDLMGHMKKTYTLCASLLLGFACASATDYHFYGDVGAVAPKPQINVKDNLFRREAPERVQIRGTAKDLETFRSFLEKKGNPHEKHGIAIDWIAN
jgi:hypothetical protein